MLVNSSRSSGLSAAWERLRDEVADVGPWCHGWFCRSAIKTVRGLGTRMEFSTVIKNTFQHAPPHQDQPKLDVHIDLLWGRWQWHIHLLSSGRILGMFRYSWVVLYLAATKGLLFANFTWLPTHIKPRNWPSWMWARWTSVIHILTWVSGIQHHPYTCLEWRYPWPRWQMCML